MYVPINPSPKIQNFKFVVMDLEGGGGLFKTIQDSLGLQNEV